MINQALILAGGLGTRLGSLTKNTPKPMILIGEKPFLHYLLTYLSKNGVSRFVLCIGYLSSKIQDYFGDGKKFGYTIEYSIEQELLGTGGAIKKASPLLDASFLVISGDNYLPLHYSDFIQSFERSGGVGMLSCWTNDPPLFRRNIELNQETNLILNYDYQNPTGKNFVDVGFKVFKINLLDYFPDKEKFSLEVDVLPQIVQKKILYGYPVMNPPLDVGTLEGLENVKEVLLASKPSL